MMQCLVWWFDIWFDIGIEIGIFTFDEWDTELPSVAIGDWVSVSNRRWRRWRTRRHKNTRVIEKTSGVKRWWTRSAHNNEVMVESKLHEIECSHLQGLHWMTVLLKKQFHLIMCIKMVDMCMIFVWKFKWGMLASYQIKTWAYFKVPYKNIDTQNIFRLLWKWIVIFISKVSYVWI